jgi:hypothetical protein
MTTYTAEEVSAWQAAGLADVRAHASPPPPQLKPCPFCGGPAELYREVKWLPWYKGPLMFGIHCALCRVGIPHWFATAEPAIAAWNHRANEPKP